MIKIALTLILFVILVAIIWGCCRRAWQNEKEFKVLIDSRVVRDNIRFIMERYHGSDEGIEKIKTKYRLSEPMTLRLIHRIQK